MEKNIDLRKIGPIMQGYPLHEKRILYAKNIIRKAFDSADKCYLALSGGKDSVAMAGLVNDVAIELNRDFALWAHISDASFPGTEETIREIADITDRKLILSASPVSAFDVIGRQSSVAFGKTGFFFNAISEIEQDHDLAFVGVRASESKRRKKACKAKGPIFSKQKGLVCYPLIWCDINDVAGIIHRYDLPIHPIYEKKPIKDNAIRLGYITSLDLFHKGTAFFLKQNYPDLYYKFVKAYPKALQYV
jgi:3'-phosphoadenosine 5'-phosphosulfate sulfotransferase (PAPS reductase)/FAD synthetase